MFPENTSINVITNIVNGMYMSAYIELFFYHISQRTNITNFITNALIVHLLAIFMEMKFMEILCQNRFAILNLFKLYTDNNDKIKDI